MHKYNANVSVYAYSFSNINKPIYSLAYILKFSTHYYVKCYVNIYREYI